MKSNYEFDESLIEPKLEYSVRHKIIEGHNGVDELSNIILKRWKKKKRKYSDDKINDVWWKLYRLLLIKNGYQIKR